MADSLFLDCSNGASGDMIVAALLDAGASEERLRTVLASLPMADEFEVRVSRVTKVALDACDFAVVLAHGDNHDHDMAYLHGAAGAGAVAAEGGAGHHLHEHEHEHEGATGPHEHGHGHHHHAHRGLADINPIIDAAQMTDGARALAHRAFDILAAAEAKAHGVPVSEVHFHEVGAVDSIVDIIAAAVCLDDLAPVRVYATPLPDGHGTVRCQHGVMPVPVPAVVNICEQQGVPFAHVDVAGELVTPTGAALVAAFGARFERPARYTVRRTGVGAGKRAYAVPSLVRAQVIHEEDAAGAATSGAVAGIGSDAPAAAGAPAATGALPQPSAQPSAIVKLECDIDDATPESLGFAAAALRAAGALEVHWLPIFTKKGRPAYQLQVIAAPADVERLQGVIFAETPTIGIRRQLMERTVLPREEATVRTSLGPVRVKTVTLPDGTRRSKPESDDIAQIAARTGRPFIEIDRELRAELPALAE